MEDPQHASSSEDGASIELAPLKLSQDITAIDLTGDDFPGSSPSNRLDLTGETDAEKRMMDLMAGRPDDIDDNADSMSIAMYAGKLPILVDTEDEEEDEEIELSSEPDNQSEDGASDDSDRGRMHGIFEDDSEGSVADSIADSDVDLDPPNMVAEPRTVVPESATLSNLTRYALATDSNPTVHLSDVRTRVELSESDDEDDESDYGLSEAEAEGMRAFYGDGPSIEIQDSFGFEDEVENETTAAPTQASNSVLGRDIDSAVLGLKAGILATKPPPAPEILENLRSNNLPVVRQPSPSDAAMVKSDIPSTGFRAYQAQDLKSEMTHALGEKSGKYAFFAAREANRAKINAEESPRPTFTASNRAANMFSGLKSTPFASSPVINDNSKAVRSNNVSGGQVSSSATPIPESSMGVDPADTIMLDSFVVGSAEPLLGKTFDSSKFQRRISRGASLRKVAPSIPTREPCDFLDKPDQFSVPYRAPSPLPDMTSAFNYHTSKDSMAAASGPKSSLRSAIKIPDIIENCSPFLRTTSLKRKSDNISHATDHELRNWAKSVASGISPVVTHSDLQDTVQDVSSGIIAPAPSALEPRPAKRFKKLLENVGYVALGGATLFAALVATAPELV